MTARERPRLPGTVVVGRGDGFCAVDCLCCDGRHDPAKGGTYPAARVVVVLAGAFHARTSAGDGLVSHGALLVGNAGDAYEYRHVDDGGDRCLGFDYQPPLLDAARASLGARGFSRARLPASPQSVAAVALALEAARAGDADRLSQAALAVLEIALAGRAGVDAAPRPRDLASDGERRVAQSLRYVEAHFTDDCSLDTLASLAGQSKFHYLRVFRALTGQTPHQLVIATRLRAAATALRTTRAPIVEVALGTGFGDVSHFHASFARGFGESPARYRSRHA